METGLTTTEQNNGLNVITTPAAMMQSTVIGGVGQELVEILKRSIKNVEDNAEYIPQATAIREQVGEIINLAKAEVQTMIALNNLKGK